MATPSLGIGQAPLATAPEICPPVRVRPLEPDVADRWDQFVFGQPQGTFFHLIGWKRVIEKTFGYQPHYFYAERAGKITGIVPLFSISNWIVGRCLVSLPLAAYGGICAEDQETEGALLSYVKELATREQVDFLELRNRNGGLLAGFHANTRYATFTTQLVADPEGNWKRLPRDTRYMIRKAEKAGLQPRRGLDQLGDFYRLFAISMRRLGTPVFPRALFENVIEEFHDRVDLLLVYAAPQPVAGVLSFLFRDTIMPYFAGAASESRALAANNFMYWELMKSAAEAGIRCFDFGRSKKGTGSYTFKTSWNMDTQPLDYQVYLVRRRSVPNFSPANSKFQLAARAWKRLPLWLTTWIGPRVVRWFP